jgi:hypothetical protein
MLWLAVSHMLSKFWVFLVETHGQDWLSQLYEGRKRTAQKRCTKKRKRTWGEEEIKNESYDGLQQELMPSVGLLARTGGLGTRDLCCSYGNGQEGSKGSLPVMV